MREQSWEVPIRPAGARPLSFHGYGMRTQQIRRFRLVDKRNVFGAPMLQRAHDRRDFGVPEGAYRATGDVLAKVRQRFQVLRAASLSDDAAHGLYQPGAALAAGTALAAGLMVEKFHQTQRGPDHAGAFLHD